MIFYTVVCLILQWCYVDCVTDPLDSFYTLPGRCQDMKAQANLDYTRFAGHWYLVADFLSYATDRTPFDCEIVDLQEDNLGYNFTESYVDSSGEVGNRTKKILNGRLDRASDAGNKAKFIFRQKDKLLELTTYVLSTDYDNYGVLFTCDSKGKNIKMHFVLASIMTRSKDKLEGQNLKRVEEVLAKYPELAENRDHFLHINFSDASCTFDVEEKVTFP